MNETIIATMAPTMARAPTTANQSFSSIPPVLTLDRFQGHVSSHGKDI
jgi:hypothetical protein